jgi:outer membrane scaffolding protein for murein synthesis (MipA/OmpV family)
VTADLGLHVIGVGEQHTLTPRVAFQVDLDYYGPWTQMLADDHALTTMSGAIVRARVFGFLHAAPTGWWISPFVQAGYASGTSTGAVAAGGISAGYAWLVGKLSISVGFGVQYHDSEAAPTFSGVWPHGDAIVGYAL